MSRIRTPACRGGTAGTLVAGMVCGRLPPSGAARRGFGRSGTKHECSAVIALGVPYLLPTPYLAQPGAFADAAGLIDQFGDEAACEAASRADRSRDLGNYIRFCHWRQIERLIVLLSTDRAIGTIH